MYATIAELYADPSRWTRGLNARNHLGNPCDLRSPEASCWCLSAAISLIYPEEDAEILIRKLIYRYLREKLGWNGFMYRWNDSHSHADVLALVTQLGV